MDQMQTPEEYLRQRTAASSTSSPAVQIAVFVVSFFVVCIGVYLAGRSPESPDQGALVHIGDIELPQVSDDDLIRSMETLVKTGDPKIILALKSITEFNVASGSKSDGILELSSDLESFKSTIDSYSKSLTALQNAQSSLRSLQMQANALDKSYSEKKTELDKAAPQLLSDLSELKQKEATFNAASSQLTEAERTQADFANELKRSQNRITDLERSAESSYNSWRNYVEQTLKPLKSTMEYSEDLLSRRLQEAKSSSGKVSVLRRELQTHSVILTESATKIAGLSHQKTILESRLKSIEQLGHDLNRKFGTNTDVSLESAINRQNLRVATVKSEYSSLPDEPAMKPTVTLSDQDPTNLPGYKKKLMQIAVDEAERKLAWLQELQTISRNHDREDSGSDEVKEEALRSFIDLKKSEIAKELSSVENEIDSERRWQERIVSELNQKNEQLKVLEHDLSSDAISDLRTQAERAKTAFHDAEMQSKALERTYLEASRKFQDAQSESSSVHERLMSQKERVRQLNESNGNLVRTVDLLRKQVSASVRANRSLMEDIWRTRTKVDQLQETFYVLKTQLADSDRQLQSDESRVRVHLSKMCKILE